MDDSAEKSRLDWRTVVNNECIELAVERADLRCAFLDGGAGFNGVLGGIGAD